MEDFNETIALNEFSLDDFRAELSEQLESDRKKLNAAPFGINAVTYAKDGLPSGVIFCLRQKLSGDKTEKVNPLQPFYLVYVRDDGTIARGFIQVKQLLEAFKSLSVGHTTPIEELCHAFNEETNNGEDMSRYDELLAKALGEIRSGFERKNQANLFTGRSGSLVAITGDQFEFENFELITWLVVKQG